MSMSVNFHRVKLMEPIASHGAQWLHIEDDAGNHISLFMPYETAERIADAFIGPASVIAVDAAEPAGAV